jgi:diaminohydroxyphosphoribosylaminopyrimidine deaminase/5-amino-6-(5-phosphoribosylamino)uracil reductase
MDISPDFDRMFMQRSLALARKGWGRTSINPLVGAVIVKNNRIVGQGYHRKWGEAHAEVCAIVDAGARSRGATLYVNLEPCCCRGITPPCVEAIVKAGIKRVVIAMADPNPAVNGKGVQILRETGIDVHTGVLKDEAHCLNRGYAKYITTKIPYVILKIAASANYKLSGFGERYITSKPSLRYVHSLRSQISAVLVGINTVLEDNPCLTDRLVGRTNPGRIVIDPDLQIPETSHFLAANSRRIVITCPDNDVAKIEKLISIGAEIVLFEGPTFDLLKVLEKLGAMQVGSILVEGGADVFNQFYQKKLYDELYLFVAQRKTDQGIDLPGAVVDEVVSTIPNPDLIGADSLYHVYRNH